MNSKISPTSLQLCNLEGLGGGLGGEAGLTAGLAGTVGDLLPCRSVVRPDRLGRGGGGGPIST